MTRELLEGNGFRAVAELVLSPRRSGLDLIGMLPDKPGVYALVIGRRTMMVGKADSLRVRLNSYRQPGIVRRKRLYGQLRVALDAGERVEIMVFAPEPAVILVGGLPVSLIVGLEAGLIHRLTPPWNDVGNPAPSPEIATLRSETAKRATATRAPMAGEIAREARLTLKHRRRAPADQTSFDV
jgi:excinuclease UvrABC nuclease subunit